MIQFSRGPTRVMNLIPLTVFLVALIYCSTMFESTVAIDSAFNILPVKEDNHTDNYRAEPGAHYLDRSEIQATWVSVRDIAASTDDDRNTSDGTMCKLSFIDRYII